MLLSAILSALLAAPAVAWSPTDSYAPGHVQCPSNKSLVREANGLSANETEWVQKRHKVTDQNIRNFLKYNNSLSGLDVDAFIDSLNSSINIGLAFSGGGYRAMLAGAGELLALDNRTRGAFEQGLGGLLQSTTYLVGLSGGNWLTGTISYNNFTSVQGILDGDLIWDLSEAIYNPGGINIFKTALTFDSMADDIQAKEDAGFNASITDIWTRALLRQFFNDSQHGAALTILTLRDAQVFQNGEMPFPIQVADGRYPGSRVIADNLTVFEFNPFEMGSWDPYLNAFTDIKYLGTNVTNGIANSLNQCVAGFDNAGFVMGTSLSLFNQFLLRLNLTGISGPLLKIAQSILHKLDNADNDIADYTPNPFYQTKYGTSKLLASSEHLYLVDGGEDLQNVPLAPLIQEKRELDVVFAFDNSADTDYNWPNGSSLVATYERQFGVANGLAFPYVPDAETFRQGNLTAKPAFFGCDASNLTHLASIPPLVVYIANRPYSYMSNTSTFKMTYDHNEKYSMIQNGFEVSSRLNLTVDPEWKACVSCAIIRRSQERLGQQQSDQCKRCFQLYCWDGKYHTGEPDVNFTLNGTTNGEEETNATSGSIKLEKGLGIWGVVLLVFAWFVIAA